VILELTGHPFWKVATYSGAGAKSGHLIPETVAR